MRYLIGFNPYKNLPEENTTAWCMLHIHGITVVKITWSWNGRWFNNPDLCIFWDKK